MAQFLHIGFNFKDGNNKIAQLKPVFDQAVSGDWLRYSPSTWIVWTRETPHDWYLRLKPFLVAPEDYVFIVKIDMSVRQGWLPQPIWDWMNKARN